MRLLVGALALLAACGNDLGGDASGDPRPDAGNAARGLPCDVEAVLQSNCTSCHGRPLAGGAPMALETYADLLRTKNGTSYATLALQRVQSGTMPPAPAGALPASDVATFQTWVNAGTPEGDCGGGGGGTTDPSPFDLPPQCTTNAFYTGGEGGQMEPGRACISCHLQRSDDQPPPLGAGGTVYMTGHEPDRCNGVPGGATVEITDATGATIALPINGAGNFYTLSPLAFPIHAKVVTATGTRAMGRDVPTGDCNSCHTQSGTNGAPGRIALP
jgi:cytochrome c5